MHRAGLPGIPVDLNEVAGEAQLVALPVRLDERNDLGELGGSSARRLDVNGHRGVFGFASSGPDTHLQPTGTKVIDSYTVSQPISAAVNACRRPLRRVAVAATASTA